VWGHAGASSGLEIKAKTRLTAGLRVNTIVSNRRLSATLARSGRGRVRRAVQGRAIQGSNGPSHAAFQALVDNDPGAVEAIVVPPEVLKVQENILPVKPIIIDPLVEEQGEATIVILCSRWVKDFHDPGEAQHRTSERRERIDLLGVAGATQDLGIRSAGLINFPPEGLVCILLEAFHIREPPWQVSPQIVVLDVVASGQGQQGRGKRPQKNLLAVCIGSEIEIDLVHHRREH
jgi:hypothetical protein